MPRKGPSLGDPTDFSYRINKVTKVVDGDTIDVLLDMGFDIKYKSRVRLFGIDTPESRTRNKEEKVRGLLSKVYLKDAIKKAIKIADTAKIGRITPRDVFKVSKPYDEEVELDELRVTNTTTKKLKMYYDKFKKAVTPREKSILSNIVRELKKRGIPLTAQYEERNYKKEYANYQGRPEQIARRSSRNKARRLMGDKVVKGMDVGHKDNNPLNNDPKNLKIEDPSKNRREPRLREDGHTAVAKVRTAHQRDDEREKIEIFS